MDDLDHSVHLAEQDWEIFYEESEKCSTQEARLASLDNSGFSDNDDQKQSNHESLVPHEANPDELKKEHGAETQIQSEIVCEAVKTEDSKWLCDNTDKDKSFEQMSRISLIDNATTSAYLASDSSTNAKVISSTNQHQNASEIKHFSEHNESCREDKVDKAIGEQIESFPCKQETRLVFTSEEAVSNVMKCSATLKTEKERWFVTVNDSPIKHRLKSGTSGQKKGKKKKTYRKLVKQTKSSEKQCFISGYNEEGKQEKIKGQKSQNVSKQPFQTNVECIYSKSVPNNVHPVSFTPIVQDVLLHPVKETGDESEKPSLPKMSNTLETPLFIPKDVVNCAFTFKSNAASNDPTENLKSNYSGSLNSSSQFVSIGSPQVQPSGINDFMTQLRNEKNPANELKSILSIRNPDHSNNISHVYNGTLKDGTRINLKACSSIDSLEELREQEHSKQPATEKNVSFHQVTQNQEPPTEVLKSPTCPIYALSPFWNEMEKLTINDILYLKSMHSGSPCSENVSPEERNICPKDKGSLGSSNRSVQDSSWMDDTAISDYFTQEDDSNPDCSSCDFSNSSDNDERFPQILNTSANPSPEPQNVKEQTDRWESTSVVNQELELSTVNSESESVDLIHLCPATQMYPQNIFLTSKLESNEHPFKLASIRKTISPVDNMPDDQCLLNFSKILAKGIDEVGIQTFSPDRLCCSNVSFPYIENLAVSESYDDFSADFEDGNLFLHIIQDKTVPIFSVSGSVVRDMVTPGVKDIIETEIENHYFPVRVTAPFSNQPERSTSFSGMPDLCFFTSQINYWRSFVSLRKIMFIEMGNAWCQKVSSWIFPKEAIKAIVPLMHLGNTALQQFPEQQTEPQHSVLISKREDFLFSLKHADMCLVCIAFASWVLKSSNAKSTDKWKTAVLANVSAISAIHYLRKYKKKEATAVL